MISSTVSAGAGSAPAPAPGITASSSSTSSSGQLNFTQNFDTFLTLLTTQLKNQNPLSPLDTNQFTQQLVSFSQVEQAINANNKLSNLIQLQSAGETVSALPVVGRTIEYNENTAPLSGGQASFSYTLPTNAAAASLTVNDAQGHVVFTALADTSAGRHAFVWNGQDGNGQQQPDGGIYTLKVAARRADGTTFSPTVTATGKVDGVSVDNGTATFNVSGIKVPIDKLITINANPS